MMYRMRFLPSLHTHVFEVLASFVVNGNERFFAHIEFSYPHRTSSGLVPKVRPPR
jgi:hypothetical protein